MFGFQKRMLQDKFQGGRQISSMSTIQNLRDKFIRFKYFIVEINLRFQQNNERVGVETKILLQDGCFHSWR